MEAPAQFSVALMPALLHDSYFESNLQEIACKIVLKQWGGGMTSISVKYSLLLTAGQGTIALAGVSALGIYGFACPDSHMRCPPESFNCEPS
eukprot:6296026-Amphidinium_carterae.1